MKFLSVLLALVVWATASQAQETLLQRVERVEAEHVRMMQTVAAIDAKLDALLAAAPQAAAVVTVASPRSAGATSTTVRARIGQGDRQPVRRVLSKVRICSRRGGCN